MSETRTRYHNEMEGQGVGVFGSGTRNIIGETSGSAQQRTVQRTFKNDDKENARCRYHEARARQRFTKRQGAKELADMTKQQAQRIINKNEGGERRSAPKRWIDRGKMA